MGTQTAGLTLACMSRTNKLCVNGHDLALPFKSMHSINSCPALIRLLLTLVIGYTVVYMYHDRGCWCWTVTDKRLWVFSDPNNRYALKPAGSDAVGLPSWVEDKVACWHSPHSLHACCFAPIEYSGLFLCKHGCYVCSCWSIS